MSRRFTDLLLRNEEVYTVISCPVPFENDFPGHVLSFEPRNTHRGVRLNYRHESSVPDDIWSTDDEKWADTREALDHKEWAPGYPMYCEEPDHECWSIFENFAKWFRVGCEPVFVFVAARSWNLERPIDVSGLVERLAVETGMARVFAED